METLERKLREQARMGGTEEAGEALIESRVRLRIQEEELKRLRDLNDQLNRENAMLRQRLDKQS